MTPTTLIAALKQRKDEIQDLWLQVAKRNDDEAIRQCKSAFNDAARRYCRALVWLPN